MVTQYNAQHETISHYRSKLLSFCVVITAVACTPQYQPTVEIEPILTPIQILQSTPDNFPAAFRTSTPTLIPFPATPTSTITSIPPTGTALPPPPISEEYLPYTIYHLRTRSYGGGQIEIVELLEEKEKFIRYKIHYPSDGLDIFGYMNVPKGEGPFPLIIMIHGYAKPGEYTTLANIDTADAFANNGYLVLHPNMRGYPPSDNGDNLYRVGLAVDILNLIALVKEGANQPGWLDNADPTRVGLWGQSLGGGVALRVAIGSEDVKALLLYSAISGDEFKNAELFYGITKSQINLIEMETSSDIMSYISPINFFDRITASVKLYHGSKDDIVPSAWAAETCDVMKSNNVDVDCIYYLNCGHLSFSQCQPEFNNTVLAFFETHLIGP